MPQIKSNANTTRIKRPRRPNLSARRLEGLALMAERIRETIILDRRSKSLFSAPEWTPRDAKAVRSALKWIDGMNARAKALMDQP